MVVLPGLGTHSVSAHACGCFSRENSYTYIYFSFTSRHRRRCPRPRARSTMDNAIGYTCVGKDLVLGMLNKDVTQRYKAKDVLRHPWTTQVRTTYMSFFFLVFSLSGAVFCNAYREGDFPLRFSSTLSAIMGSIA